MKCNCRAHNGFLTASGLKETAQRDLELSALDSMGISPHLDRVGSVSASGPGPDPHDLYAFVTEDMTDEMYRRFHNGS